jgi:hypothetical protein
MILTIKTGATARRSGGSKMKRVAFLLIFLCGIVHASDWQILSSSNEKSVFMDFSSVSSSGSYKKAWVQSNFFVGQNFDQFSTKRYSSEKTLFYFDCVGRTLASTQDVKYSKINGDGEVVSSIAYKFVPSMLNDVVPDTEGELFLRIACNPSERERIRSHNKSASDQLMKRQANSVQSATDNDIFDAFIKGAVKDDGK